jgi:hypothetical protein
MVEPDVDHVQRVADRPLHDLGADPPAAWSLIMFSQVTPLFGPKYFLLGRA